MDQSICATSRPPKWSDARLMAVVALAALVMGLPTLRGGFVGGDDHRLVVDHVLVNHPSLEHAVQIFTIVHRDLYQPLPLLMFSGEFALAEFLGLWQSGPQGGAWLFHLINILLHVFNTILVWRVVAEMQSAPTLTAISRGSGTASDLGSRRSSIVATVAALLFAVHPLCVETVAWVNGRMMLLSTLFALLAILVFARWLAKGRAIDAFLVILCVFLSAISKVRVGLPLFLGLIALVRRDRLGLRFWAVFSAAAAVTAIFVWVNIGATAEADLFSEAAEHLQGPREVRVLLALASYFSHFVWPVGLTSYYPTPPVVQWTDPEAIKALWIVLATMTAVIACSIRVPAVRWGAIWYFVAVADTLPFVPARNVLAADRYVYLAIPGLLWAVSAAGSAIYQRWTAGTARCLPGAALVTATVGVVPVLLGMSWYTARWYDTPLLKTERVARVFPHVPRVWERFGWTQYSEGDYDGAMESANREFVHKLPNVQSGAYQLLGMCRYKQGQIDEALRLLHKALDVDPTNDLARFRLGMVYDELGRYAEALPYLEACVAAAPMHNPTIHRLGNLYRRLGRFDEARRMYTKELENNPYEMPATIMLAELDFASATPEGFRAAERRLLGLLDWMPENVAARVDLAHLYEAEGDVRRATEQYGLASGLGFETVEQACFAHDFHEQQGAVARTVELWSQYLKHRPNDPGGLAMLAWSAAMNQNSARARAEIAALGVRARDEPMAQAAVAYLALEDDRHDIAAQLADRLAAGGSAAEDARRRLLRAIERFDLRRPGIPWTYYLAASLLMGEGRVEAARAFADLFASHCDDPVCGEYRARLEKKLSMAPPAREE